MRLNTQRLRKVTTRVARKRVADATDVGVTDISDPWSDLAAMAQRLSDEPLRIAAILARTAVETAHGLRASWRAATSVDEAYNPFAMLDEYGEGIEDAADPVDALDRRSNRHLFDPFADIDDVTIEGSDLTAAFVALEGRADVSLYDPRVAMDDPYAWGKDDPDHPGEPAIRADEVTFSAIKDKIAETMSWVTLLGEEDGHNPADRGRMLRDLRKQGAWWCLVDPIDGTRTFRTLAGGDFWGPVIICGHGMSVAVVVATASGKVAAASSRGWVRVWESAGWQPLRPLPPALDKAKNREFGLIIPAVKRSSLRTFRKVIYDPQTDLACAFSGNPAILVGVLLGRATAAYQPPCWAWDIAVAWPAALAGFVVLRLDDWRVLTGPDVLALMMETIEEGTKMPGIVVARDPEAATVALRSLESIR